MDPTFFYALDHALEHPGTNTNQQTKKEKSKNKNLKTQKINPPPPKKAAPQAGYSSWVTFYIHRGFRGERGFPVGGVKNGFSSVQFF